MKKILLLGRAHTIQKEHVSDISEQLRKWMPHDFEVVTRHYSDLVFDAQTGNVSISIPADTMDVADFDFVYMMSWYSYVPTRRDIAFALAHYLTVKGVPFVNSEAFHNRSSSKISQMVIFALNDIPVVRTVFSLSAPLMKEYIANDTEMSQRRLVVKDALASRGADNYLVDDEARLDDLPVGKRESQPFIVQPFVPNDKKDWRVVIMDGEPVLIIERNGSDDSHLNNTSQGGSAMLQSLDFLPEEVMAHVKRAARLLHRDVTGIDVMYNTERNEYVILEANALPQLATGSFVDEKMQHLAAMIAKKVQEAQG